MERRINVVQYRISSTKQHRHLFGFEALIMVLKGGRCLFQIKATYFYQVLRLN